MLHAPCGEKRLLPLLWQFFFIPNKINKRVDLKMQCFTCHLIKFAKTLSIPGDNYFFSFSILIRTSLIFLLSTESAPKRNWSTTTDFPNLKCLNCNCLFWNISLLRQCMCAQNTFRVAIYSYSYTFVWFSANDTMWLLALEKIQHCL
jgi:hypothetical protein